MRPIQQLDEEVIGHIAAGEVVERPAQVVKELIENSIDAGSHRIEIRIKKGGFQSIEVSDDGHGIPEDQLHLAFRRHATSKINGITDLERITTKGFRGEALASIGIVSKLTISSRPVGQEGKRQTMSFGRLDDIEATGMAEGTRIIVKSLFENVPARLAFQARPTTETARIVDIVTDQAMVHPEMGISLIADERVLLDAPRVGRMEDRLYDLLGDVSERLIPLSSPEDDEDVPGKERWTGWISAPEVDRSRSDEVRIFINHRPVGAQPFHNCIRRGYTTRMMVGRHPVCVLHLTVPEHEVDVNVHPTKREVRLKHAWRVLNRLERAISHTLTEVPVSLPSIIGGGTKRQTTLDAHVSDDEPSWVTAARGALTLPDLATQSVTAIIEERKREEQPQIGRTPEKQVFHVPEISVDWKKQSTLPGMEPAEVSAPLSRAERDIPAEELDVIRTEAFPELKAIGQFENTYILAEAKGVLYIIDQHAAHERIRFERLRRETADWTAQKLIQDIPLQLSATELIVLENTKEALAGFGYEVKRDEGGQWFLLSVPEQIKGQDPVVLLHDLIRDLEQDSGHSETFEKERDRVAYLTACRGAIKANDQLEHQQVQRLLNDLRTIENPWACVHGRPTSMELSLHALDRHFGRHG